jgi:hypothetical protein
LCIPFAAFESLSKSSAFFFNISFVFKS